jgi:hypothetical protein
VNEPSLIDLPGGGEVGAGAPGGRDEATFSRVLEAVQEAEASADATRRERGPDASSADAVSHSRRRPLAVVVKEVTNKVNECKRL